MTPIKNSIIAPIKNPFKLDKIKSSFFKDKGKDRKRIALLVDGPNMLRKEFQIDLEVVRDIMKRYGDIKVGKVFLNQYASDKLVEAIENQGFEPIIGSGDVDVRLAVDAMELVFNQNIDTLAIVTRDADFKPVLSKANMYGKETIVFGAEPGLSIALKNVADYVIVFDGSDWHEVSKGDVEVEAEAVNQ
ncbi:TIGR00288 family protein [Methanocella sp. CWC-04]|uniref:TIGR00288 family protein n=1 Tax=Methanooceanicella nereidis TaxID=2052831 RepID=A0AAP2W4N7_9EURY|nr:TIGR00288 family NYN domain-containing protein [Methanocella sp. CWC-04]MCD1294525.1 TIGR00288 family protein [Methanocella sp. CWC-04]